MSNMIHIPLGLSRSKGFAVGLLAFVCSLGLCQPKRGTKIAESALEKHGELHSSLKRVRPRLGKNTFIASTTTGRSIVWIRTSAGAMMPFLKRAGFTRK